MAENTKIFTGGGMFTDAYKEFTKPFEGEYFNLRRADVKGLPESDEEIFYNPTESYGGTSEESSVKSFFSAKGDEEEKVQDEIKKLNTQMQSLGLLNSPLHRMKQQRVMRKFQRKMTPMKDKVVEAAQEERGKWYDQVLGSFQKLASDYIDPITPSGDDSTITSGESTPLDPAAFRTINTAAFLAPFLLPWQGLRLNPTVWENYDMTSSQLGRQARINDQGNVDILQDDIVKKGGPGSQGWTVFKAMMDEGFLKGAKTGNVLTPPHEFFHWWGKPPEWGSLAEGVVTLPEDPIAPDYQKALGGETASQKRDVMGLTYGDLMRRYRGLNPTSGPSNY